MGWVLGSSRQALRVSAEMMNRAKLNREPSVISRIGLKNKLIIGVFTYELL
jgi:hypothetical protein